MAPAVEPPEMTDELSLRRKWTFRAHGRQVVLVKRPVESGRHVFMKAFLWALYLPAFPDLAIEVGVGGRYKPDLVSLDAEGRPRFWGECGHVGVDKLRTLLRKHRSTHFALARWSQPMHHALAMVNEALDGVRREAPVDVVMFSDDAAERFIGPRGDITVTFDDLKWVRVAG